jgi:phage host-nuclease inhibitor protein Gam
MATNGNSSTTQQLETLEAALTGARRVPAPVAESSTDDVVARVDAAAELCREVGRYASDHGRYLDEISAAFAERLQAMTAEYASNMLAAERRKMAELERILGKLESK